MTRADMDNALIAELDEKVIRPCWLVHLQFDQPLYMWSGRGPLLWDGKTWLGNGWLRPIKAIAENDDLKATGVEIELGGAASELTALVLSQAKRSRTATVYLGLLNSVDTLHGNPYPVFIGRYDTAEFTDDGEDTRVVLKYESQLLDLAIATEHRYTHECQKLLFPSDRGFEYMETLADWEDVWIVPAQKKKDESRRRTGRGKRQSERDKRRRGRRKSRR